MFVIREKCGKTATKRVNIKIKIPLKLARKESD